MAMAMDELDGINKEVIDLMNKRQERMQMGKGGLKKRG